ncbi:MAG TPA: tyrosine-type recombinase/integrase [Bacteroidia bacterium]|nr:tyrosine-type recombinase/integrase [Bacteroidia bacterium]
MASVYKRKQSPVWYAAYFRADGSRVHRSTGHRNKQRAIEVAVDWEKAETAALKAHADLQPEMAAIVAKAGREASAGQLTLDRARRHLMELYKLGSGEEFPSYSVKDWLKHWLGENRKRVSDATMRRYETSVSDILAALGNAQRKNITLLTTEDVQRVQTTLAKVGTKASTANFKVQDFKNAIRAAFEQGIIERNVGLPVKALPTEDSDLRGEFTVEEIRKLIGAATPDWKGAILIAAQTGLRLSNIAELAWSEVHLDARELVLTPVKQRKGKTEVISIPMTDAVFQLLKERTRGLQRPAGAVFPTLSGRQKATLSTSFRNLMTKADVPRTSILPGGKIGVRSFHSLRHYYVSALANAHVPEDVRKTLAAHKSGEIHRIYTHHNKETLRQAISLLPTISTGSAEKHSADSVS